MDVVPVLDLLAGRVVHARRGDRDSYQPIKSSIVDSANPLEVAVALMALAPFRRLYVADLDAIRGKGGNDPTIAGIAAVFRDLEIWVDRGESDIRALQARAGRGPGVTVVGTESFPDVFALKRALRAAPSVLSLDHDAFGPIGPREAHEDARLWPDRVIVMTLARVGAGEGPDWERLDDVVGRAEDRAIYAAGGVRGPADLAALESRGIAGALVASAIHDGRLSPDDLSAALRAQPRTAPRP